MLVWIQTVCKDYQQTKKFVGQAELTFFSQSLYGIHPGFRGWMSALFFLISFQKMHCLSPSSMRLFFNSLPTGKFRAFLLSVERKILSGISSECLTV